ncbi:MAG: hypothetical protein LUI87_11075, partial [Lachnospiraceae bacterium]|nr:hypothetical protein [Lachnospiraceae bacterium]
CYVARAKALSIESLSVICFDLKIPRQMALPRVPQSSDFILHFILHSFIKSYFLANILATEYKIKSPKSRINGGFFDLAGFRDFAFIGFKSGSRH